MASGPVPDAECPTVHLGMVNYHVLLFCSTCCSAAVECLCFFSGLPGSVWDCWWQVLCKGPRAKLYSLTSCVSTNPWV